MMKLDLEKLAREMAIMAYNAYLATLVGNASKSTKEAYRRFQDVQLGDLVVETTTCLMDGRNGPKAYRPALDAVGYLLRIEWEPIVFSDPDFVWNEEEEGQPHPKEKCFYIRTLDGREFRWTNASLISAPTEWPIRGSEKANPPPPP